MSESYGIGQATSANKLQGASSGATTFSGHINEFDMSTKRLYEHLQHLTSIADRLTGARPEPVERVGNPEPPVSTIMLGLQRRSRDLGMGINAIVDQAGRIEGVLGETTRG